MTGDSGIPNDYYLVSQLPSNETILDYALQYDSDYKEEIFADLFLGVAKGVNYLHDNNIILCNLKADNIMLERKHDEVSIALLDPFFYYSWRGKYVHSG